MFNTPDFNAPDFNEIKKKKSGSKRKRKETKGEKRSREFYEMSERQCVEHWKKFGPYYDYHKPEFIIPTKTFVRGKLVAFDDGTKLIRTPIADNPYHRKCFFEGYLAEGWSFSGRIEKWCDLYYGDVFTNDSCYRSLGENHINLMGMDFELEKDKLQYNLIDKHYDSLTLISIGRSILRKLHSINDKGFISSDALSNIFLVTIAKQLVQKGFKFDALGQSEICYTMWYNFIFINFYYLVEKFLIDYKSDSVKEDYLFKVYADGFEDVLAELDTLRLDFKARLEQYLKLQLQIRGITIIENTYMGFDTEYTLKDHKKFLNELVSVQTATQRRFLLKMPLYKSYDISYVNPLSSLISDTFNNKVGSENSYKYKFKGCDDDKLSVIVCDKDKDKDKEKVKLNEVLLINNTLKLVISKIRCLMFKDVYDLNSKIIGRLKESGVEFFEDLQRDQIVFYFPLTPMVCDILYPSGDFGFLDLLDMSKNVGNTKNSTFRGGSSTSTLLLSSNISRPVEDDDVGGVDDVDVGCGGSGGSNNFIKFVDLLNSFGLMSSNVIKFYNKTKFKPRARTKIIFNFNDSITKVSLTIVKNIFVLAHYNAADLSMLSDFNELKKDLSIVNKSFVSLGKPLRFKESFVYIRDTILLAPGGKNKLRDLSKLYSDKGLEKREISNKDLNDMRGFLKREPERFKDYALHDAVITLKHAVAMEEFNMKVNQIGVPLTLSSIGRKYVVKEWSNIFQKHLPYQVSGEYLMGNADEIQTPKGLFSTRNVGTHMSYFIANYKGGRNESFMYGMDDNTHWIDYDLTSAYTTGMADLALPDYYNAKLITKEELFSWGAEEFLRGYLIVNVNFEFPEHVKYPSIPCYVDKTTTVYPLKGENAFLTGPEYWLAKQQGCVFTFLSAFYIYPKTKSVNIGGEVKEIITKPFFEIFKDIQAKRREYPKGTIYNLLYKEMGNSIYGNVVRGISNKMSFDSITGKMFRVTGTELSNPILASWSTAFVRSVIGECLHNIQKLGGKVVSVTTDGFITNIKDLEGKLLRLPKKDIVLLTKYRSLRETLTDFKDIKPTKDALEIKSEGKGIISWTTRGQMGVESDIIATTGFQRGGYDKNELIEIFKNTIKNPEKVIEYTRKSLRSAKDIFDKGGHVTSVLKDQNFRLIHDNRREMIHGITIKNVSDLSKKLLDSKPLIDMDHCKTLRFLSKFPFTLPYNKNNTNRAQSTYKSHIELGVRNFIKAYHSPTQKFGLQGNEFKFAKDLITFINGIVSDKVLRLSVNSISKLKNRRPIIKPVPPTPDNLRFCELVKQKYPYFRDDMFLKMDS